MAIKDRPKRNAAVVRLGDAIRDRRTHLSETQEHIAYEAGVALRTYQGVEAGRVNAGYLTLVAIATALGLRLGELLNSVDDRAPSARSATSTKTRR